MRLRKLIDLFCAWSEGALAVSTTRNYRYLLLKFANKVGNLPIAKLKPFHLTLHGKSWHEVQSVQRLFQWAKDDLELVDRNPFSKVKRPPAGRRTRVLSPRELARYLRRSRPSLRRFLIAMRETLARPQEIRAITWEMLACENPRDTIEEALANGRAIFVMQEYKARERRVDPSVPRLLLVGRRLGRLLLRLLAISETRKGPVLLNTKGKPISGNAVRCAMRRLRKRCRKVDEVGLENVVAYTFRHSLATIAAAAGVRDRVLADIMGHTSTRTTARYQHLQVSHLREAMDAIEDAKRKKKK